MKNKSLKILSLTLVAMVMCSLPVGCGIFGDKNSPSGSAGATGASSDGAPQEAVKKPVVLTGFGFSSTEIDALTGGDPNNTPAARELERRTGVTFKWILATPQEAPQKLQLMLSSKDVPDVFGDGGFDTDYPGGASRAAEDGIIVKLNPYLDTLCPDYKKVFTSNTEYEKMVKADNGDIYGFATFMANKEATVYFGPMIRKDILDRAGVPIPETIDEWHTALKALKDNGISKPLSMLHWFVGYSGAFIGAYGVCESFYVGPDAKVHYGAIEDGYRKFLDLFNKWCKEGLIDPDYLTIADQEVLDARLANGKAGAALNWMSCIDKCNMAGKKMDVDFNMVSTKYPVLNKGDKPLFSFADKPGILQYFVGATGKHVKEAIEWYNYGYTEEGQILYNFGIKDVSYIMENGVPTYTDEILKEPNSQGWSKPQARQMYLPMFGHFSPCQQHPQYFTQMMLSTPQQKEAASNWADGQFTSNMPPLSYMPSELIVMKRKADIDAYMKEQTVKFILGEQPLSAWDGYVKHIKDMDIDELLDVYNKANERYKAR